MMLGLGLVLALVMVVMLPVLSVISAAYFPR